MLLLLSAPRYLSPAAAPPFFLLLCADLRERIEKALGGPLDSDPVFFSVRDVAPNKQMFCASFRVPRALAFPDGAGGGGGGADGAIKRQRIL